MRCVAEHRSTESLSEAGAPLPWVYVGTPGLDGVDALLTHDSPPFQNGCTNYRGTASLVKRIMRLLKSWFPVLPAFDTLQAD